MGSYISIFHPIPCQAVGITVLQTSAIYVVVIIGLKLVGRRVFAELGPQDLVVLLLVSEATNLGLTHEDAGFWGTLAAILTILAIGGLTERIEPLKRFIEDSEVIIFDKGKPLPEKMKRNLVDDQDLESAAHRYGMPGTEAFETMILESDGSISGILKPQYRTSVSVKDA